MKPLEITDANFDLEVLQAPTPVVVDFWAVWCGPCKAVSPLLEQLAGEYDGKLKVGKLDVDSNPMVTTRFNIRSIPTIMVFQGGRVVEQVIGALPKRSLLEKLQPYLLARGPDVVERKS